MERRYSKPSSHLSASSLFTSHPSLPYHSPTYLISYTGVSPLIYTSQCCGTCCYLEYSDNVCLFLLRLIFSSLIYFILFYLIFYLFFFLLFSSLIYSIFLNRRTSMWTARPPSLARSWRPRRCDMANKQIVSIIEESRLRERKEKRMMRHQQCQISLLPFPHHLSFLSALSIFHSMYNTFFYHLIRYKDVLFTGNLYL